jgi:hypothetical protein
MPRTERLRFDSQGSQRGRSHDPSASLSLEDLKRRFAKFHGKHPPQTQIPVALRRAVLAAMDQGVTRTQVRRTCGVSSSQIDQWQQSHAGLLRRRAPGAQDARVFAVEDDIPNQGAEPADRNPEHHLELRLGGWSISVRQVVP